jgi:methylglutaconyl-CoA hydratase
MPCHLQVANVTEHLTANRTTEFLDGVRDTFTDLQNLRIPTISAVDSFALGGGLEMALCTTLRVFGSSATVGLPETRLAIVPGAGGTFRLPQVIGLQRARDMVLTGRRVTGAEAYFLGLCDRLIEVTEDEQKEAGKARGKVLDASLDLAKEICAGGPIAIGAAMDAVNGWQRGDAAMREAYDIILKTEDRMEALRAFAEKRKPVYKGQ